MFPADGSNVKLGKGALFLAMNDPDTGDPLEGEFFLGNAPSIEITPTINKVELFSSTEASAGLVATNRTSIKYAVAASLSEFKMDNLALFLIGKRTTANQIAATSATKNFIAVELDRYYQLGARKVTNVVGLAGGTADGSAPGAGNVGAGTMGVITRTSPKAGVFHIVMTSTGPTASFSVTDPDGIALAAGAVGSVYTGGGLSFTIADGTPDFAIGDSFTITESAAMVAGTDYELNSQYGTIYLKPTSTVVRDGIEVFFTFDKAVQTIEKINIGAAGSQIGRLVYRGDDSNSDGVGSKDVLEVWRVEVTPNGALGLITTDYGTFGLAIDVLSDAPRHTGDEQYGRWLRLT